MITVYKEKTEPMWIVYFGALLANLIWGFSNTLTQLALCVALPEIVLAVRFLTAILTMSLFVLLGKAKLNFRKPMFVRLFLLGVIELVYFYCESYGIVYTNVTCSGVILAVSPIVSTAFAAFFLKEYPTAKQVVYSVVAVAGVIMITAAEGMAGEIQPFGLVLLFGGCICSAVFRIINRSIVGVFTTFERTYMVLLVSAVAFSLSGLRTVSAEPALLTEPLSKAAFWIPVLALGLCSSVGANMMANYAAEKLSVVRLSVFGAVCTICSMAGGILFLHEPVTPMALIGAVMIVVGIWKVNQSN